MGFIIWALVGMLFIIGGIYCINSKKEVAFGFWANAKTAPIEVKNIKAYNKALGKLWCAYGFFFILLGYSTIITFHYYIIKSCNFLSFLRCLIYF